MTHRNETKGQAARRSIIAAMRQGREYTSGDLERMTGVPAKSITQNMPRLVDMGLVERTGGKEGVIFYGLCKAEVAA